MPHANAPLTPVGRQRLATLIIDQGWPIRRAAERFQVSPATASKWAARYRAGEALEDRSSRPHRSPLRLAKRREHRIISLRFTRQWGPHRISYHLGIPRSTIERVLTRYRMPRLAHLDRATGLPDGGGWRMLGRTIGNRNNRKQGLGYAYLHHAVDDHSRLAYSEILHDEKQETAAGFWERAREFFQNTGISVTAVMTDNGSCYRSRMFAAALGPGVKHRRTRPYRPQTNGKVERFNRTLATEWAYAEMYESDAARAATYADWLHHYNHHRPHTGIGGLTPSERVHNLTGNYT